MTQYELWWAELALPVGRRPVLLLSRAPAYHYLSRIIIAEVSTTIRDIPQEVLLGRREGLAKPCVASLDNVHVVPKTNLVERIGALSGAKQRAVKRALGCALAWPELTELE